MFTAVGDSDLDSGQEASAVGFAAAMVTGAVIIAVAATFEYARMPRRQPV